MPLQTGEPPPAPRRSPWVSLALGFLLAPPLVAVAYLGYKILGAPFVAFDVFDWMARTLPGPLITFGIDTMVRVLTALGFNLRSTAKLAEQMQAVTGFLVTAGLVAALYFYLIRSRRALRALLLGVYAALALGFIVMAISLDVYGTASIPRFAGALWIFILFAAWGLALGWTHLRTAPVSPEREAEPVSAGTEEVRVHRVSRRRFIIEIGGAAAALTVAGAGVAGYLRLSESAPQAPPSPPVPLPNAGATVQPVSGTRPEYTPLDKFYRIDIDTIPPDISGSDWHLEIRGLVANPTDLTLDDIRTRYRPVKRFITLGCISNPIGGPLISTTLWTGAKLSDVLADVQVDPSAAYVHVTSEDGFHETVPLDLLAQDDRIMLTYEFDAQPLPREHGYPLRIWIPNRYGMKQPKWIVGLEVSADYTPGYWVERGWSEKAIVNTTSVIDTVLTDQVQSQGGTPTIPVGGIAWAGDRGIQRVQVRSDGGAWQDARLREPLSDLTWVIWRYAWPFTPGKHTLEVRAQDGTGAWQVEERTDTYPDGATGLHQYVARVNQ